MNDTIAMIIALLTGVLLGVVFFGGLWWTLQKILPTRHSTLWFLASLILRTSVVLTGFYVAGHNHFENMLMCLLGFLLARFIVTRLTRLSGATHAS
ncbi:MAG: hypothetical protein A2293_08630 [Elusimicrobia bacterium RIFOXYB2_FULL_49_7]|nr:MAG: hypothetical protein A2293_08630 [Elusimicrobia bacterium RIFOXYB2_FULL_49_7]